MHKDFVPNLRTAIYQLVFMQDNALCQTVKSFKTFLSDVTDMEWPAQSPHMNPIEKFWKLPNGSAKERIQEISKNYGLI